MIYYNLEITSSDGNKIEIKEKSMIKSANVFFNTINNQTQKKSNAMLATMELHGQINRAINAELIKISEWSIDFKNATTYRNVILTIMDDEDNILRIYEIPSMFVCDYKESYGSETSNDVGEFDLLLTQKENALQEIKTYTY